MLDLTLRVFNNCLPPKRHQCNVVDEIKNGWIETQELNAIPWFLNELTRLINSLERTLDAAGLCVNTEKNANNEQCNPPIVRIFPIIVQGEHLLLPWRNSCWQGGSPPGIDTSPQQHMSRHIFTQVFSNSFEFCSASNAYYISAPLERTI